MINELASTSTAGTLGALQGIYQGYSIRLRAAEEHEIKLVKKIA